MPTTARKSHRARDLSRHGGPSSLPSSSPWPSLRPATRIAGSIAVAGAGMFVAQFDPVAPDHLRAPRRPMAAAVPYLITVILFWPRSARKYVTDAWKAFSRDRLGPKRTHFQSARPRARRSSGCWA